MPSPSTTTLDGKFGGVSAGTETSTCFPSAVSIFATPPFGTVTSPLASTPILGYEPVSPSFFSGFITTFPFGSWILEPSSKSTEPAPKIISSSFSFRIICVLGFVVVTVVSPIEIESFAFSDLTTICLSSSAPFSCVIVVFPVLFASVLITVSPDSVPLSIPGIFNSYFVP